MNEYLLQGFTDASRRCVVSLDREVMSVRFQSGESEEENVSGFIEPNLEGGDFLLAEAVDHEHGTLAPNWNSRLWVFVESRLASTDEVVRCDFRDFLFVRRFRIWLSDNTLIQKTYSPGWRDLLFPSDPMFPWGRDFYKFMIQKLARKVKSGGSAPGDK